MSARRLAWAAFACSLAPRMAALAVAAPPEPNFHWRIADSLLTTSTFALDGAPTGAFEPLYPLFLATLRWTFADNLRVVMFLQVLLASAGGVLVFRLVERKSGSRAAAMVSALCYALYPYYVRQSVEPTEVTLSVVLLVATAWHFPGRRGARAGAGFGCLLAALLLLRMMFAPLVLVALLLVARRGARTLIATSATLVALAGAWWVTSLAADRPVVPSRVGENLHVATCPPGRDLLPLHDVDLVVRYAYAAVGADALAEGRAYVDAERAVDRALLRRSLECARREPLRTAWVKLRNAVYVFSPRLIPVDARTPRPRVDIINGRATIVGAHRRPWYQAWPHLVAHSTITIAAVAGFWMRRRRLHEDVLILAMLANTVVVYALFFPTTRLVAPTAFVLMCYAGVGLTATIAAARRRP